MSKLGHHSRSTVPIHLFAQIPFGHTRELPSLSAHLACKCYLFTYGVLISAMTKIQTNITKLEKKKKKKKKKRKKEKRKTTKRIQSSHAPPPTPNKKKKKKRENEAMKLPQQKRKIACGDLKYFVSKAKTLKKKKLPNKRHNDIKTISQQMNECK